MELISAYSKRQDLIDELVRALQQLRLAQGSPVEVVASVRTTASSKRDWRVGDRLSETGIEQLVAAFTAGTSKAKLAEHYGISESSVKRLIRKHGASKPSNGALSLPLAASSPVLLMAVPRREELHFAVTSFELVTLEQLKRKEVNYVHGSSGNTDRQTTSLLAVCGSSRARPG